MGRYVYGYEKNSPGHTVLCQSSCITSYAITQTGLPKAASNQTNSKHLNNLQESPHQLKKNPCVVLLSHWKRIIVFSCSWSKKETIMEMDQKWTISCGFYRPCCLT